AVLHTEYARKTYSCDDDRGSEAYRAFLTTLSGNLASHCGRWEELNREQPTGFSWTFPGAISYPQAGGILPLPCWNAGHENSPWALLFLRSLSVESGEVHSAA